MLSFTCVSSRGWHFVEDKSLYTHLLMPSSYNIFLFYRGCKEYWMNLVPQDGRPKVVEESK